MRLEGARVLVTGGARRVGAAIVAALAAAGARVAIHCRQSAAEAEELLAQIGGTSAGHRVIAGDLRDEGFVDNLFPLHGPFDALVNNAAIFRPRPLAEQSWPDAREHFQVNFWAPTRLMRHLWAQSSLASGCVVNILDSRIALPCRPDDSFYLISKQALAAAGAAAAAQWAPRVRVNAVAPGAALPPAWLPNSPMRKEKSLAPGGRLAKLDDIADACLFLLRNDSVNGETIFVDGGAAVHHPLSSLPLPSLPGSSAQAPS